MSQPKLVELIANEQYTEFNRLVDDQKGEADLSGAQLRARDLRKCHLKKANLKNAYLRLADLRGVDLSEANLEGASLRDAKISGTYFPKNLEAQEIDLSLNYGSRLRIKS